MQLRRIRPLVRRRLTRSRETGSWNRLMKPAHETGLWNRLMQSAHETGSWNRLMKPAHETGSWNRLMKPSGMRAIQTPERARRYSISAKWCSGSYSRSTHTNIKTCYLWSALCWDRISHKGVVKEKRSSLIVTLSVAANYDIRIMMIIWKTFWSIYRCHLLLLQITLENNQSVLPIVKSE